MGSVRIWGFFAWIMVVIILSACSNDLKSVATTSKEEETDILNLENTSPKEAFDYMWGMYDSLDFLEYEVVVDYQVVFEEGWDSVPPEDDAYKLKWKSENDNAKLTADLHNDMEYRLHTKFDYLKNLEETQYEMTASMNELVIWKFDASVLRDYEDELLYLDADTFKELPRESVPSFPDEVAGGSMSFDLWEDDRFYYMDYYQPIMSVILEQIYEAEDEAFQMLPSTESEKTYKLKINLPTDDTPIEDPGMIEFLDLKYMYPELELDDTFKSTLIMENSEIIFTMDERGIPLKEEWDINYASLNDKGIKEYTFNIRMNLDNLSWNETVPFTMDWENKKAFSYYDVFSD